MFTLYTSIIMIITTICYCRPEASCRWWFLCLGLRPVVSGGFCAWESREFIISGSGVRNVDSPISWGELGPIYFWRRCLATYAYSPYSTPL